MSFGNKILMGALRLVMRFSNPPEQDADKIYAHAKAHNESRVFKVPKSGRIEYIDEKIHTDLGSYHCLRIKRKGRRPSRAVLYICGGGGTTAGPGSWPCAPGGWTPKSVVPDPLHQASHKEASENDL